MKIKFHYTVLALHFLWNVTNGLLRSSTLTLRLRLRG